MAVRYLYSSDGDYVAFIQGDNVFSPDAEWLGFVRGGNQMYFSDGSFAGYIMADDRVAKKRNEPKRPKVAKPFAPFKPFRPLRPLKRLRMPRLPYPFVEVPLRGIEGTSPTGAAATYTLAELEGGEIYAADDHYLGRITANPYDAASITHPFGQYGNQFNPNSLFNNYGPYGNKFSPLSPYNQYSRTPPRIVLGGKVVAYLTENDLIVPRLSPDHFMRLIGKSA